MKKTDNKGFSLVELIIVIAIMAVLIGILAPQFIKYVERSRNSTDVTNAQEITSAIQVYASDSTADKAFAEDATGTKVNVTASTTALTATGTNKDAVEAALKAAGLEKTVCKSKTTWTSYFVNVKVSADGNISCEYGAAGSTDSDTAFKNAME